MSWQLSCPSKPRFGHGHSYHHHFKRGRGIIDVVCFGFRVYLKYLQKRSHSDLALKQKVYADRQGNQTAGCQFDINKANFYHWKDSMNSIYSWNVATKCFTWLLWAELRPSSSHMLKALIQYDWCPSEKRKQMHTHTYTHKENTRKEAEIWVMQLVAKEGHGFPARAGREAWK